GDGGAEALRDDAADDLVHELVALVSLHRLEHDVRVAELSTTARLLLVAALRARLLPDRLEVRDARLMEVDVDVEPRPQPRDGDFDVHLREAGEKLLASLRVAPHLDRRVLLRQPTEPGGHLLLVALRLGRHGEAHDRI